MRVCKSLRFWSYTVYLHYLALFRSVALTVCPPTAGYPAWHSPRASRQRGADAVDSVDSFKACNWWVLDGLDSVGWFATDIARFARFLVDHLAQAVLESSIMNVKMQ